MNNWYKRRLRKIGYSFVAAGLATAMTVAPAAPAFADAAEESSAEGALANSAWNPGDSFDSAIDSIIGDRTDHQDESTAAPAFSSIITQPSGEQRTDGPSDSTEEPSSAEPVTDEEPDTASDDTEPQPTDEHPSTEVPPTTATEPDPTEPVTEEPTDEPGTVTDVPTDPSADPTVETTAPADAVIVDPQDYSAVREAIVKQAVSLVGKVNYFWGGKSTTIGWDSRWGIPQVVTVSGSVSSGTTRYFGLDCSGYVAWVFANAYGYAGILSQFGFNTPEQWANSYEIQWQQVQIGDLLFKTTPYSGKTNHVGVVVEIAEDGTIWVAHCSSSRNGVVVTAANSSGFKYIRRPNLLRGDVAAPAIVNLADLKIPEGVEISDAATALAAVDVTATRKWETPEALAADLAVLFPDATLAAAVAEGLWNTYAQIPDAQINEVLSTAVNSLGILKASEVSAQLASCPDNMRELSLDAHGFSNLLDMVRRAEITVTSVGPSSAPDIAVNESPELPENPEIVAAETAVDKILTAADYVNVSAEAESMGESLSFWIINEVASQDKIEGVTEIYSNVISGLTGLSREAILGIHPQGEDVAAKAPEEGGYVPVESIEGIQYLRSARKIDLTNNNIHDLLPLDYYRVDTDGQYIYNKSIYYQNTEGLWLEDERGVMHEDGALPLYFGGGLPGSANEYKTELYISGNPIETSPDEFPGRLWVDYIEQAKVQEMSMSVAAERFAEVQTAAADDESKEDTSKEASLEG